MIFRTLFTFVIVFVGSLGAAVDRHRLRPITAIDLHQPIRNQVKRLIPGRLAPFTALRGRRACAGCLWRASDEWSCHAVRVVEEVIAKASLHAQVALVDDAIVRRGDTVNKLILDVQMQITPHATIGAGGGDNAVRLDH